MRVVRRRAVDWLRRAQHSGERNAEHARELQESAHAWMSPELALEERELNELHAQTLGTLPDACRRTYLMVREEEETYDVVARRLGVSRSAVSSHVVEAQRRFRRKLATRGIVARGRDRAGR